MCYSVLPCSSTLDDAQCSPLLNDCISLPSQTFPKQLDVRYRPFNAVRGCAFWNFHNRFGFGVRLRGVL